MVLQGYKQQVEAWEARCQDHRGLRHAYTLLMLLPAEIDLATLPAARSAPELQHQVNQDQGGIGYARLAIQLVAYMMGMEFAWMLDDNIQDLQRLHYEQLLQGGDASQCLKPTSLAEVMHTLESMVRDLQVACMLHKVVQLLMPSYRVAVTYAVRLQGHKLVLPGDYLHL